MRTLVDHWRKADPYHKFELVLSSAVMVVVSVIACAAVARLAITMIDVFFLRLDVLEPKSFQVLFGMIFVVLISLEFNRTILHSLSKSTTASQIKGVVLIAIMVVVRKLIISDPKDFASDLLVGLAALLLALGAVHYLVAQSGKAQSSGNDQS